MTEEFEEDYDPEYLCIKFAAGDTIVGELVEETESEISLGGVMSISVVSILAYSVLAALNVNGNAVALNVLVVIAPAVFSMNDKLLAIVIN